MKKFILDLLFPIQCLGGCHTWDVWLCSKCLDKINKKNKITLSNHSIAGLYYLTEYNNPIIRKIIYQLKYGYSEEISLILSPLLAKLLDQHFDYIIPIPLHKKRLVERGFNQAELLAKNMAVRNAAPAVGQAHVRSVQNNILCRTKYTQPQAQIKSNTSRKKNIHDAFKLDVKKADLIRNKKILLLDDVYTTGSTMNEAANALLSTNAQEIWGIVLAKG